VFVPEVVLPPPGAARTAATQINADKVCVYLHSATEGGARLQRWTAPASWAGRRIGATTITPSGREEGHPKVTAQGPELELMVTPGRPIVLSVGGRLA